MGEEWTPDDIPEEFWDVIKKAAKDRKKLTPLLEKMTREEMIEFFRHFVFASQAIAEPEYVAHMAPHTSEDGAEDVSTWVVGQGKKRYLEVYNDPAKTPKDVEPHSKGNLYFEISPVFHRRFKEEIWMVADI